MESLRNYLVIALIALLAVAGNARAQVPSMAARSLSLASPPNSTVPFASLTNPSLVPQTNGTITYCSNCSQTTVCAAGGSGAVAVLANNAWQCATGTSTTGTASINPGTTGQVGGYLAGGTVISPLTSIQATNVNSVLNAQAYGAKADGTTDNTTAIKAAIAALPSTGGTLYFPASASPYNFNSQITVHKNTIIQCGGAPNSTVLHYTGTTGAALVWSDAPIPLDPSDYYMGGWKDCELNGPGSTTSTIGIYVGGDPAGIIAPAANYGDFLTFWGGKIQNFGTGFQVGNNSWEDRFYSTIINSNTTGYYIPNNIVQPGENMSVIGGAIQNTLNDVVCNNPNADAVFTNVSFDGGSPSMGPAIRAGNATGSQQGCGVTLQDDHFEFFGNSIPAPIFAEWGTGPYTNIKIHGGAIQLDDDGSGFTLPAIADVAGGYTADSFELSGVRISSGGDVHFTNTCKLKGDHMCISGDDAAMDALVTNYGFYQGTTATHPYPTNVGNPGPSHQWGPILIPATTTNTDVYGVAVFDSPVFVKRMSIAYTSPGSPSCSSFPIFYIKNTTSGVNGAGCTAVAGRTSCLGNADGQAVYVNAGDQIEVGTANPAVGCTAGTNFYVTLEYRP